MHWWTTKKFLYCCVTLKNFIFKRQQMKANIHQISKNLWKRQYQSKKLLKQKPILLKGVNSFNLSGFLTDGLTKMKTQGLNKYINTSTEVKYVHNDGKKVSQFFDFQIAITQVLSTKDIWMERKCKCFALKNEFKKNEK